MSLELPVQALPRTSAEAGSTSSMTYLCEHYAASGNRRQRYLFAHTAKDDAHTALCWLLERVLCLVDQLPPEPGQEAWLAVPDEEDQAVVLEALAAGKKYKLEYFVRAPDDCEQAFVEGDTTHVFSIEPEPAEPPPPGTGRHRKGPFNPSGQGAPA